MGKGVLEQGMFRKGGKKQENVCKSPKCMYAKQNILACNVPDSNVLKCNN